MEEEGDGRKITIITNLKQMHILKLKMKKKKKDNDFFILLINVNVYIKIRDV